MDFAIIAAGEGSRLKEEGIGVSKPMVNLQGVPLVQRLIRIFLTNGAERIVIIINERSPDVEGYLKSLLLPVPLVLVKKNTSSSLHSFYEILPYIKSRHFCLTTVDTVFEEEEFSRYIQAFVSAPETDGLMAVTTFVDDEKPLYVQTGPDLTVTAYSDVEEDGPVYVSGGIYCLRTSVLPLVQKAVENGLERMRNFQRLLISEGLAIRAYPFTKIIDIDHVHDLELAEEWLQTPAL